MLNDDLAQPKYTTRNDHQYQIPYTVEIKTVLSTLPMVINTIS